MSFHKFAPNLSMSDNPGFDNYCQEIVHDLMRDIDTNFAKALDVEPFSTCQCFIEYHDNDPFCMKLDEYHMIFLSVKRHSLPQWIYQFAHEYCHHLINGELVGDIYGYIWFEETICELASMYQIHTIYTQWIGCNNHIKNLASSAFQPYLDDLLTQQPQLLSDTLRLGFLTHWEQILSEQIYHRNYYNALAARMFPLFVENPSLWKIILYFGDMRKWGSLRELFDHLRKNATPDYSDSLNELRFLLLS